MQFKCRDKVSNVSSFASKTVREALQLAEEEVPSWAQFVRFYHLDLKALPMVVYHNTSTLCITHWNKSQSPLGKTLSSAYFESDAIFHKVRFIFKRLLPYSSSTDIYNLFTTRSHFCHGFKLGTGKCKQQEVRLQES